MSGVVKFGKLFAVVLCIAAVIAADGAFARGAGRGGGGRSGGHSGHHHHSHHSGVFIAGSAFFPSWYYYPYGGVYPQPALPMQYIERGDDGGAQADGWLYCPTAGAYFPSVVECAGGWQQVPAK